MIRVGIALAALAGAEAFAFPAYCAKVNPSLIPSRAVPDLSADSTKAGIQLLHVFALVRHGARTPAGKYQCWPGYTPQWDCRLEETISQVLSGSSLTDKDRPEDSLIVHKKHSFTFLKAYDAHPAHNVLGGTCKKGQLLAEGYQQHELIGSLMAEAYQNGKLGQPALIDPQLAADQIYFRSSDLQRTIASGSVLLSSFFRAGDIEETQLVVHTMDDEQDTVFPNMRMCPALASIRERIFASAGYQEIQSRFASLEDHLRVALKRDDISDIWPGQLFDCLVTTVCSEQLELLPPGLRPSVTFREENSNPDEDAHSLLNQTFDAVNEFANFEYTWRHAMFSKAAMASFMIDFKAELFRAVVADVSSRRSPEATAEILASIIPPPYLNDFYTHITQSRRTMISGPDNTFDAKKLVVVAAHDTTIMPFLAALEGKVFDGKWPPYASQLLFELYRTPDNTDYNFRMIYNGKVITHALPGCQQVSATDYGNDLCSLTILFENTGWATPSAAKKICRAEGH